MQQHEFQLQNGRTVPALMFGTYKTAEEQNEAILLTAIEAGYRGFDTASFYGTEGYLGSAIQKSGLSREEVFLTSKLWKTEMGYDGAMAAARRTASGSLWRLRATSKKVATAPFSSRMSSSASVLVRWGPSS